MCQEPRADRFAPELFATWMSNHVANDKKFGRKVFRYHPRSDEHSKSLCKMILNDFIRACPLLADHIRNGTVVCAINTEFDFNGKTKTLDLAIGEPADPVMPTTLDSPLSSKVRMSHIRFSCEAKQTMTEHSKSIPRLFDELSSSHAIVHREPNAIAAGIVVVNIADRFASPTRQQATGELIFTAHTQPYVAARVIEKLSQLTMSSAESAHGFDAFAVVTVNCDNVGTCTLHTETPSPQGGHIHHYQTFINQISSLYATRFGNQR